MFPFFKVSDLFYFYSLRFLGKLSIQFPANKPRKITLGLRIDPNHKHSLTIDAAQLGITLSELAENRLLNYNSLTTENKTLQAEVEKLRDISSVNNIQVDKEREELRLKTSSLEAENLVLKGKITSNLKQMELFSEKRLLELFESLKGKEDTIQISDKEALKILYQTPSDLLTAMIYSFKLKKP